METQELKIDRTKLKKISTYASDYGITPQRVYQLISEKKLKMVEIDKVKFIQV